MVDDVKIEPIERVDTSVFPITQPVIDLESKDPLGDIPCFDNAADFVAATCHTPTAVAATGKYNIDLLFGCFKLLVFSCVTTTERQTKKGASGGA